MNYQAIDIQLENLRRDFERAITKAITPAQPSTTGPTDPLAMELIPKIENWIKRAERLEKATKSQLGPRPWDGNLHGHGQAAYRARQAQATRAHVWGGANSRAKLLGDHLRNLKGIVANRGSAEAALIENIAEALEKIAKEEGLYSYGPNRQTNTVLTNVKELTSHLIEKPNVPHPGHALTGAMLLSLALWVALASLKKR